MQQSPQGLFDQLCHRTLDYQTRQGTVAKSTRRDIKSPSKKVTIRNSFKWAPYDYFLKVATPPPSFTSNYNPIIHIQNSIRLITLPLPLPSIPSSMFHPPVLPPSHNALPTPAACGYNSELKMKGEVQLNIDDLISTLLQVRTAKPGKLVKLRENDILGLIRTAKAIFLEQPMLVEVTAPVKVCGDIHGQYYDMLRLFEYGGMPPESSYLFLGDYVDRGRQGIETICLLFALKIKHPSRVFILRGNHESASITRIYGFYQECKSRYNVKLWKSFVDCFNCMPVAALIEDRILCMHGGLSPDLASVEQINAIVRPTDIPDTGLLCDLLWADPEASVKMWGESERGVSFVFGQEIISAFLRKNELDLICRAHQVVEDGYEFFAKKQLVTVFSAPNYCGEFNNSGAMMRIEEDLTCSFQVLRPEEKMGAFKNNRPKTPIKRGGG